MTLPFAPEIIPASASDLPGVEALLEAAKLPTMGLVNAPNLRLWVLRESGRLVGAIGLERYGTAGLLRSLVVAPSLHGRGLGGALVGVIEQEARAAGMDSLVLLTETAEPFFARRGYLRIERNAAPDSVKDSAEFRSLCPASAATLMKVLG